MDLGLRVNASNVVMAMATLRLGLAQRQELMRTLGAGQLVSIRRTFAESGSPAGSWRPLSPNSLRWGKYSAGHKLLIRTGLMLNSIGYEAGDDSVVIGTSMGRARIHQLGFTGSQTVRPYSYTRKVSSRDRFGKSVMTDKNGKARTVRRKMSSGITTVRVGGFTRHISIPARPFLVFRPEDPARISTQVRVYVAQRANEAGLEAQ